MDLGLSGGWAGMAGPLVEAAILYPYAVLVLRLAGKTTVGDREDLRLREHGGHGDHGRLHHYLQEHRPHHRPRRAHGARRPQVGRCLRLLAQL